MSDNKIIKVDNGFVPVVPSNIPNKNIPKPFERDIFLFYTRLAGCMYIDEIESILIGKKPEEEVFLFREPDNPHDRYAIIVKDQEGEKLGYIPSKDNKILARLMDAGKKIIAKIDKLNDTDLWDMIHIKIYLID